MSDNTVFCRKCNAPNQPNNKFCSNCGASLKPATHITCPNCFHRNSLQVLYCDNCGTRLVRDEHLRDETDEDDETLSVNVPTGFSLPSRNPGDTADLDPDSLPEWLTGSENSEESLGDDDDWLGELNAADSSTDADDLFALNDDLDVDLDWLSQHDDDDAAVADDADDEIDDQLLSADVEDEPEEEPPAEPTDDFDVAEILGQDEPDMTGDFDWLSVMGEAELEEPEGDSPRTGFTGLLNPDALQAIENADENDQDEAAPQTSELADWLADETAVDADSSDEWLRETSAAAEDDADEFDFDGEEAPEEAAEPTGFTDWLQTTPIDGEDSDEHEMPATPAEELPDWLVPPEEAAASEETAASEEAAASGEAAASDEAAASSEADDSWLEALETGEDAADDDELPEWMETPQTGELDPSTVTNTGFTGWLNAQDVDEFEAQQAAEEPAAADEEPPDWLEAEPPAADADTETQAGTGFTGWLDTHTVESFEAETVEPSPPAQDDTDDDVPEWLQNPPESADEAAGTGFTDWLQDADDESEEGSAEEEAAADDDEFDWMDEETTQELMRPLTSEEAQKMLENTPDVTDEFIQEVVEGDFPEWLTDVKNVEDIDETGILPSWISAPVSESDTLTVGLGRDLPTSDEEADDWLASLEGESQPEEDNDWFEKLGTYTADDFDEFGGLDEEVEDTEAFGDFVDEITYDDAPVDEEQAGADSETMGDDVWLEGLTAEAEEEGDDWLAGMPGLEDAPAAAGGDDWLSEMPGTGEADTADDSLFDLPGLEADQEQPPLDTDESDSDNWLDDLPEDEGQPAATETWLEGLGGLGSEGTTDGLDWLNLPLDEDTDEAPEEQAPLPEIEEPEEPRDPTLIDPVLDFENFEVAGEDAGELDWLSMIEDEDEPSEADDDLPDAEEEDEDATEAWLMGADLADEPAGSQTIADDLRAVVFSEEDEPGIPAADLDSFGDDWESDLMTPMVDEESEDILQELRAMRMTDRLDPEMVEAVRQDEEDPEINKFITREHAAPAADETTSADDADLWDDVAAEGFDDWSIDPLEREQTAQVGGPLNGLRGVVNIAPVMASAPAAATAVASGRVKVESTHEQQAVLLKQLARPEWAVTNGAVAGQPAAETRSGRRFNLTRIILGVVLLLAVLLGLFLPNLLPTATPGLSQLPELPQLNQALNGLNNQTVLVAFEYPPALAGELNPQAQVLLTDLAARGNSVIVMSQYPTGLDSARPVYDNIAGLDTSTIGYIPGEALGLRELATCLNRGSCQAGGGQTLNLADIGGIVVLTGERDNLVNWIEQIEPQTEVPIIFGVTEALGPLARPYLVSNQIDGLLGGLSAAAVYEQEFQNTEGVHRLFQAQGLVKLVAIAALLVGMIMAAIPNRQSGSTE